MELWQRNLLETIEKAGEEGLSLVEIRNQFYLNMSLVKMQKMLDILLAKGFIKRKKAPVRFTGVILKNWKFYG